MKQANLQYLRETIKEQKKDINPAYNISFNALEALYRKASSPGNTLDALADAFIFGYAMGVKASKEKPKQ